MPEEHLVCDARVTYTRLQTTHDAHAAQNRQNDIRES